MKAPRILHDAYNDPIGQLVGRILDLDRKVALCTSFAQVSGRDPGRDLLRLAPAILASASSAISPGQPEGDDDRREGARGRCPSREISKLHREPLCGRTR